MWSIAQEKITQFKVLTEKMFSVGKFLTVCAWCQKVRHKGQWIPRSMYKSRRNAKETHTICPSCKAVLEIDLKQTEKVLQDQSATNP